MRTLRQFPFYLGTLHHADAPFRRFSVASAVGLVITTALGIAMAFRVTPGRASGALDLATGTFVPVILLWIYD